MKPKPLIRLARGEYILTAYCQPAAGPGWANTPLWVIIGSGGKPTRTECIQPEDQTPAMYHLYGVCATAHAALMGAVSQVVKEAKS